MTQTGLADGYINRISIFTKDKHYSLDEHLKSASAKMTDGKDHTTIEIRPPKYPSEDVTGWPIIASNKDGEIMYDGEIMEYTEDTTLAGTVCKYYCVP